LKIVASNNFFFISKNIEANTKPMWKKVVVAGLAIGAGVGVAYWLKAKFQKDPVEDPAEDPVETEKVDKDDELKVEDVTIVDEDEEEDEEMDDEWETETVLWVGDLDVDMGEEELDEEWVEELEVNEIVEEEYEWESDNYFDELWDRCEWFRQGMEIMNEMSE